MKYFRNYTADPREGITSVSGLADTETGKHSAVLNWLAKMIIRVWLYTEEACFSVQPCLNKNFLTKRHPCVFFYKSLFMIYSYKNIKKCPRNRLLCAIRFYTNYRSVAFERTYEILGKT